MSVDGNDNWLDAALEAVGGAKIAVFGDFCVDAYWLIDTSEEELSVETGLPVRRVRRQRYSLGGAGNVVANLVDLGVGQVRPIGLVGDDLFGRLMLQQLQGLGVSADEMLCCQDDWQTMVFAKPCVGDAEQKRIDFGAFNAVAEESVRLLAGRLEAVANQVDAVILNQQVPAGVSTPRMIEKINRIIAAATRCRFIVDSRHRAELYRGAIVKLNAHEGARIVGRPQPITERIPAAKAAEVAGELFARTGQPVFLTRGENGLIIADQAGLHRIPGIGVLERTDTVGAGDTLVSALVAALAVRADNLTAGRLANIAASVTVRKFQTTGTATPREIRQIGPEPDYVFLPELADDPRRAEYLEGSEIEIIRRPTEGLKIRHAIFDHDGTLSTLREGWERIMEPMMIRAILGPRYEEADETLYHKVADWARAYIDKTTGVQTLVQMQGLVEMVRQFGCVPEADLLDMHGYKARYNETLLAVVRRRIEKLRRGELSAEHFQIAGAEGLLRRLVDRGVRLYLASGTDQADVAGEAEAMGYAEYFQGGIFGAVGDVKVEAKRVVLERIIGEHGLGGASLVTFGDGPVEIRETHKRGGLCVGLASDELRRFGLNPVKRARLIRAGADLVVPDFTQLDPLLELLGLG